MRNFLFGNVLVLISSIIFTGQYRTYGFNDFNEEDYRMVFPNNEDNGTLKLVHVMFRHGNRTIAGVLEQYPLDPHLNNTYFPYGTGQLTDIGKRKLYFLGKDLRTRYNTFLGKYYYPEIVEASSTDVNRTKMSLQLVLAGLFPPIKEDAVLGIPWQPIPYNFLPQSEDRVLSGINCPKYLKLYAEYINRPLVQRQLKKHKKIFKYLSENTGLAVKTFKNVYKLNFGLTTEEEYGLVLPEWTKVVWPEQIKSLSPEEYFIAMGTPDMRRIAVGYFLDKILKDTKAKIRDNKKLSRKMYLYSAHENNLAALLISLGVFEKHIPAYGSHIILELHKINGVFGFKIYYECWDGRGLRLMQVPGCKKFCPIEEFTSLIKEYLPTEHNMCGN